MWGQAARLLRQQQQQHSCAAARLLLQLHPGGVATSSPASSCPRTVGALSGMSWLDYRRPYSSKPPEGPGETSGHDNSGSEGKELPISGYKLPTINQTLRPGEALLGEAGGDAVSEMSEEAVQGNLGRLASEAIRRLSMPSPAFEPREGEEPTPTERFDEVLESWGDMLEEEDYDGVMHLMHREFGIDPNELFAPVENLRVTTSKQWGEEEERARAERLKEGLARKRVSIIDELGRSYATGKRKTSIARVWLWKAPSWEVLDNRWVEGRGGIVVNNRSLDDYFKPIMARVDAIAPFDVTSTIGKFFVRATVKGGGVTGQAQAVRHGIAKALQLWDPEYRPALKAAGFLMRDSRIVERKKPGKAKARKSFQWVKR